jgi:hypothetical protein
MNISQNGKELSKDKYTIDEKARCFSTTEDNLVIDAQGCNGWTFRTGNGCTLNTGNGCTSNTGGGCTFKTGWGCTFKTGWDCTFNDIQKECVCIRRDIYEVIELPEGKSIKLNEYGKKGWTEIQGE